MSIQLVFCLIISLLIMPLQAQASEVLEMATGGSVSKVTYSQNNNTEEIRIYSTSTKITKQYLIAPEGTYKNYRLGFEIDNADVSKTIRFDINKGTVVQIRLANMSDPKRTSVVVETTKKPAYAFSVSPDGKSIILTLGTGSTSGNSPGTIPSASPGTTPAPSSPAPSVSATPKPSTTPVPANNSGSGSSSNTSSAKTSNGPLSITVSGDTCTVTLKGITLTNTQQGNVPRFELREKEKMIQITIPGKDTRFTEGFLTGNSIIYGALISFNNNQNSTIIRIPYNNTITYSHSVSGGNSTFVIKAGNTSVPVNNPAPSSTPVVTPKPSTQPSPSSSPSPSPSSSPSTGTPSLDNIKAGNDDKTALIITGKNIVDKYNQYKDKIIVDDTGIKGIVTFMIPNSIVNLGNDSMNINNNLVKSIEFLSTSTSSFLSINKKDANMKFEIVAGSNKDELVVAVSSGTGGSAASKLVVIDPGHGGTDPGAVFGEYFEKVYNLDIALRCEKILKSKGINVALTRTTDKTVSLNDRVKFANDLNAYLFVSIHNNSMPSGIKGSMVLYHYTSYRGKPFAQIMLDNLVKDLGTEKIGIQARQNTVVLRDTKMPAILVEVACMSHPDDLALLNTDSFLQKAAESIANSIIQILNSGI
ncbi:MAG: hypothetical protein GX022_01905 [Clostridiaceae bacterium]|nr:hypothetical protein [Clostridiaceae bacterium]